MAGLHEQDLAPDPFQQFDQWFHAAKSAGVIEPNAMTVTTVDADGAPAARTALLKGVDERGFVFFTNYESTKGQHLAANPRATLLFPWLALERQVIISGEVSRTSREETETYFQSRPRGSQLGAWASAQSTTVADRAALESNLRQVEARFSDEPIPAPPHWGGFRVSPHTVEFWQGRPSRLHDRLRFRRDHDSWSVERLSP